MWFNLIENICNKYKILDNNIYNFNKISFIISISILKIVVIGVD